MAKTIQCDICQTKADYTGPARVAGWSTMRVDHRRNGNIGGTAIRLDICPRCDQKIDIFGSYDRAVDFIRTTLVGGR